MRHLAGLSSLHDGRLDHTHWLMSYFGFPLIVKQPNPNTTKAPLPLPVQNDENEEEKPPLYTPLLTQNQMRDLKYEYISIKLGETVRII